MTDASKAESRRVGCGRVITMQLVSPIDRFTITVAAGKDAAISPPPEHETQGAYP